MKNINRIASKLVLSYLIGKVKDKEQYAFFNARKFPILFVKKVNDKKYEVYKFVTMPEFIRRVSDLSVSESQLKMFYNQMAKAFGLNYYWNSQDDFILSAMQNNAGFKKRLDLLKKKIASYAFFLFKNEHRMPNIGYEILLKDWEKELTLQELAKVMVKELNASIPEIEEFFEPILFNEEGEKGDLLQFKYNKWNVVFENGLKNKDDIIKLLDAVESKCGRFKSMLCYGLVEVKRKMTSNVLADYNYVKDTMRIKGKRPDAGFVRSFLHELGHRMWFVHLSPQLRSLVKNKYSHMLLNMKYVDLKIGDIVGLKDGFKIQIDKVEYNGYSGVVLEKPQKKRMFKEGDRVSFKPLKETNILTLNEKRYEPEEESFPTTYSQKNPEEFFAECFSHFMLGTLNSKLTSWMKELIG